MKTSALITLAALVAVVAGSGMNGRESQVLSTPAVKEVKVGEIADTEDVHLIERPGLYGVSDAVDGTRYAIVGGNLVRLSASSNEVRSIIRPAMRAD